MLTLANLITEVRAILDEPVAAQYSDVMLTRWLDEGNRDLARSTRAFKDQITFPAIADNAVYPLPPETVGVEQVYLYSGGQTYNLSAHHFEDFDALRHGYASSMSGGIPTFYSTFGFTPNLFIVVFPAPNLSTDSFEVYASRLPAPMDPAHPNDPVDVLAVWYDALADYCEYKALRRDRDPRWQEAFAIYKEKRDGLINNPDYLPVSRGVVPTPGGGYLPDWLIAFD